MEMKRKGKSFSQLIDRHLSEIKRGGIKILLRKIVSFLKKIATIPLMILLFPVVLCIRIVKPWVLVRFGGIVGSRIGHFAVNTELYLCSSDINGKRRKVVDLLFYLGPPCNMQLHKMFSRVVNIRGSFVYYLNKVNKMFPESEEHAVSGLSTDRDIYGWFDKTEPHLRFTDEEELLGLSELRKLGVPEGKKFICMHARDSAYLDKVIPHNNWEYHNHRDCSINSFLLAADELTKRGYYVIRVGFIVKEELQADNPMIIDYAKKARTDFMDIYLGAKCHFFLGSCAGVTAIPVIFRRPNIFTNYIPIEYVYSWSVKDSFIPKKLKWRDSGRLITLKEVIDLGIGRFLNKNLYDSMKIDIIDNTPEEILDIVIEMEERLRGVWQQEANDENLQKRFWSFFKKDELNNVFASRIGSKFIKANMYLLEQ